MVEHAAVNRRVVGSSPTRGAAPNCPAKPAGSNTNSPARRLNRPGIWPCLVTHRMYPRKVGGKAISANTRILYSSRYVGINFLEKIRFVSVW